MFSINAAVLQQATALRAEWEMEMQRSTPLQLFHVAFGLSSSEVTLLTATAIGAPNSDLRRTFNSYMSFMDEAWEANLKKVKT